MKTYKLKDDVIARDQEIWMGLDVHKNSVTIAVLDEQGLLCRLTVEPKRKHLEALVARLPGCRIHAVYEAGPTGYTLLGWLRDLGCKAFMVAPSLIPNMPGNKVKTDKRDAFKLATLLRAKMLEPIFDLTATQYRERELLRTREQVVAHQSNLARQIKSKLLFHGIEPPEGMNTRWTIAYVDWLIAGVSEDVCLNLSIATLARLWKENKQAVLKLDKEIEALSQSERHRQATARLRQIPGIGLIWAMVLQVEIGDWGRFENATSFCGFTGLVPGACNTGGRERATDLMRRGNPRVRRALVEASWTLIQHDPTIRAQYERFRRGKRASTAIVAVARRLGLSLRAMMLADCDYDSSRHARVEPGQQAA
jgi:transposase